jgi:hypothetical protein
MIPIMLQWEISVSIRPTPYCLSPNMGLKLQDGKDKQ